MTFIIEDLGQKVDISCRMSMKVLRVRKSGSDTYDSRSNVSWTTTLKTKCRCNRDIVGETGKNPYVTLLQFYATAHLQRKRYCTNLGLWARAFWRRGHFIFGWRPGLEGFLWLISFDLRCSIRAHHVLCFCCLSLCNTFWKELFALLLRRHKRLRRLWTGLWLL